MHPPTAHLARLLAVFGLLLLVGLVKPPATEASVFLAPPNPASQVDDPCAPQDEMAALAKGEAIDALVFDRCPSPLEDVYYGPNGVDQHNCGLSAEKPCRCLAAAFRALEVCSASGEESNVRIIEVDGGLTATGVSIDPSPIRRLVSQLSSDQNWAITLLILFGAVVAGFALGYGIPALLRRRSAHS